jgi:hypothetical protein
MRLLHIESPPLVPEQFPPGIIFVSLRDIRDELKLPHVTTECAFDTNF